jgi:hypothetical protein
LADCLEHERMRSTLARLLRQNQLLVERYAVHKINKVEYPLPQNAVTVKLTNSWWFGPVRLDPVAPEPRLGSPLRTTLNL